MKKSVLKFLSFYVLLNLAYGWSSDKTSDSLESEDARARTVVDLIVNDLEKGNITFRGPIPSYLFDFQQKNYDRLRDYLIKENRPLASAEVKETQEIHKALFEEGVLTSRLALLLGLRSTYKRSSDEDQDRGIVLYKLNETNFFKMFTSYPSLDKIISFWKGFEHSGKTHYEAFKALCRPGAATLIKCGEMVFRPQEVLSLLHFTQMPAYFVHHVSPDPNYSLETLNKATAYQVGLVGDPFGKASFDGHIDQPPLKFATHDLVHLFEQYTFGIWGKTPVLPFSPQEKAYDGSEDAYLKMFRDLWVKMHQHKEYSKEDELVYFNLYHENSRYFTENHISEIIALKAKSENLPLELFENFKKRYVE